MSIITDVMAAEHLVKAIYLTLLHSLWQGAAIAGLAGIVILVSKRSSAVTRYNFLAVSMGFFVLCTIVTFIKFMSLPPLEGPVIPSAAAVNLYTSKVFISPADQLFTFLSAYSGRIVLLWFLIICLKSLQFYFGLQQVSDLKTKQVSNPEAKWTGLADSLSETLGIRRKVALLESALTSVPLTVGYLKPVILVPLGMLTAIPADQVEAILLHELAHIKRKDYFINIFQSIVELLFFFNPAIWWLSSLIRAERENCCDDIAIANSSSKINYVRALISFEEYRIQRPQIVIAITGSENTLLKRTRRIIHNQNNTLNSMEKFILTSGLVLSGLLSFAFTNEGKEKISKTFKPVVSIISQNLPATSESSAAPTDTIPASSIREISTIKGGLTTFKTVHQGKTYRIVMKEDEVTELYINNQKIPQDKIGDHTEALVEIFAFSDAMKTAAGEQKKQAEELKFAAIEKKSSVEALRSMNSDLDQARNMIALKEFAKDDHKIRARAMALKKEMSSLKALARLEALKSLRDTILPKPPKAPSAPPAPKAPAPSASPNTPAPPAPPKKNMKAAPALQSNRKVFKATPAINVQPTVAPAIEVHVTPAVSPAINVAPKTQPAIEIKHNEFTRELNLELVKEGLVKDSRNFSYKINNNELIVDGVKQSIEQHHRIIKKVLKNADDNIDLTYSKRQ
ncbi:MAG: M56 family metallopeptidase [Daejeonella sp.]